METAARKTAVTFDDLPNEIIFEISTYLGIDNIPFSITCKRFNKFVDKRCKKARDIIEKINMGKELVSLNLNIKYYPNEFY
jgi:hypothetical protein